MPPVYLGLGTNLGDREQNLRDAISRLKAAPGVNFLRQSRVYQTEPMHIADQPEFLNMVVEIGVPDDMSPRDLLTLVKQIETDVGRQRRQRWGPREIDIDILLFGEQHIVEGDFEVPHPRMWERAFVMAPLAELAPDLKTPGGETAADLAKRLSEEQRVHAHLHL
ncbi:MAG TPA: 2-amino-4-hydroxy-6-hydroxymethyldihydropteridine diphosphokinase [Armatimonadota bacterium]|nr:2-amino-4-hydroxy-6-hydroxymethyldihydropteridine diphosphokinase [Armatimonadota bacterium]